MHPENEPPTVFASDSEVATWWGREYLAARRRNRLRRTVRNVLTTVVTFAAFTALYVLVVAVEHG